MRRCLLPWPLAASAVTRSSLVPDWMAIGSVPDQLTQESTQLSPCGRRHAVNIYVGNLPFDASDSDLRSLFTEYGTVDSASVITDRETGRSRGFGFVELADEAMAAKAISDLNGHDWRSRVLSVNEARPRSSRS